MASCGAHVARCTWPSPATRGWIDSHAAAGTAHLIRVRVRVRVRVWVRVRARARVRARVRVRSRCPHEAEVGRRRDRLGQPLDEAKVLS